MEVLSSYIYERDPLRVPPNTLTRPISREPLAPISMAVSTAVLVVILEPTTKWTIRATEVIAKAVPRMRVDESVWIISVLALAPVPPQAWHRGTIGRTLYQWRMRMCFHMVVQHVVPFCIGVLHLMPMLLRLEKVAIERAVAPIGTRHF